jgi:hypothetical protein
VVDVIAGVALAVAVAAASSVRRGARNA